MNTISVDGKPVIPSKIICIGRNYVAHIAELGNDIPDEMVVFNKPNSAIGDVLHAQLGEPLSYESELAFVIQDGALGAVGFGLDITKRNLQSSLKKKGLPWERAKAFDGAVLLSEFVDLPEKLAELTLKLHVNDSVRQEGGVSLMMYKPEVILQELKKFMTLENGDVIMTGTPAGVGVINAGERFVGTVLCEEQQLLEVIWLAE